MASLKNKLLKGKQGLAEVSVEELARRQGRPVPTTPLIADRLGANPDQTKMIGTPNQKRNAIKQSMETSTQPKTLSEKLRNKQDPVVAAQSGLISGLEGLSDRLTDRVGSRATEIAEQNIIDAEEGAGLVADTGLLEAEQIALQAFVDEPTADNLVAANKALGVNLTAENMLSHLKVDYNIQPYQDTVMIDEAFIGGLGIDGVTNITDLYAHAGMDVPGDPANPPTLNEFLASIQEEIAEETAQVDNLVTELNNPNLGPAERAEMRSELKDMGVAGLRTQNDTLDRIAEVMVDETETVSFMGEELPVGELLNSEFVTSLIASATDDLATQEERDAVLKQIGEISPELVDFLKENETALGSLLDTEVNDTMKTYAKTVASNAAIGNIGSGGLTVSDSTVNAMIPGFDLEATSPYDVPPILQLVSEDYDGPQPANEDERTNLVANLNAISNEYPELARGLAGTTNIDDLRHLGLLSDPDNSEFNLVTFTKQAERIAREWPNLDKEFFAGELAGFDSYAELIKTKREIDQANAAGFNNPPVDTSWMDINNSKIPNMYVKDGQPRPIADMLFERSKNHFGNGGKLPNNKRDVQASLGKTTASGNVYEWVKGRLEDDGTMANSSWNTMLGEIVGSGQGSNDVATLDEIASHDTLHGKVKSNDFYGDLRQAAKTIMMPNIKSDVQAVAGLPLDHIHALGSNLGHASNVHFAGVNDKMLKAIDYFNLKLKGDVSGLERWVLESELNQLVVTQGALAREHERLNKKSNRNTAPAAYSSSTAIDPLGGSLVDGSTLQPLSDDDIEEGEKLAAMLNKNKGPTISTQGHTSSGKKPKSAKVWAPGLNDNPMSRLLRRK